MLNQDIKVSADAMVFSNGPAGLQLLLIQRGNDPYKGMWALPGGFVEDDEELEAAAIRELEEETGLKIPAMTQLHTFGKVGRDPRFRTISATYYAVTGSPDKTVKGADDAAAAKWMNVKDITEMAFDHMEILRFALKALKAELA